MIKCEICNKSITSKCLSSIGSVFGRHITYHHKITPKEYYDLYIKREGDDVCKTCGKITNFRNITIGYQKHCNSKCAANDPMVMQAKIQTQTERYGGYGFTSPIIRDKYENTIIDKYGSKEEYLKIRSKSCENTMFNKYNMKSNLCKNENMDDRLCDVTMKHRYGKCSPNLEKSKLTLLQKYGVDNIRKSDYYKEKVKRVKYERYGTETYNNRDKATKTCILKYGVTSTSLIAGNNSGSYKIKKYYITDEYYITYQSNPELEFIKQCIDNNIEIHNGDHVKYLFDNKLRYYHVDFKIKINDKFQLIEIKGLTPWYYSQLESGMLDAKINAAKQYSNDNGYLPYKMIMV